MKTDEQRKFHIACGLFFAAVFGIMFVLSFLTPLIADDFNYTFGYASDRRISSVGDIWKSMMWHRKILNGRVFSHGWLSLVLIFPRWFFAALNAGVAVFFSWTCVGFFRERGVHHPLWSAVCVWMMLWICMPGFGQVYFWTAGACNYFWGMTFAWFLIWRVLRLEQNPDGGWWRMILLLLPAFAFGAWSEHISFAMLMILFFSLVREWIHTGRLCLPGTVVFLSGCAGYLYLMLAPASKLAQRFHDAGDATEDSNLARIIGMLPEKIFPLALLSILLVLVIGILMWKKRGIRTVGLTVSAAASVLFVLATLFFVLKGWRENGLYGVISSGMAGFFTAAVFFAFALWAALRSRVRYEDIIFSLVLAFSGLCSLSLFLFGEYLPLRGFCAPVTLLILGGVMMTGQLKRSGGASRGLKVLLCVWFAVCFALGAKDIIEVHRQAAVREAGFEAAAAGDKRLITKPYVYKTKYTAQYGNADLSPDADWPNGVMADYYDVVRIVVEP